VIAEILKPAHEVRQTAMTAMAMIFISPF
jgi:hypothetical protein